MTPDTAATQQNSTRPLRLCFDWLVSGGLMLPLDARLVRQVKRKALSTLRRRLCSAGQTTARRKRRPGPPYQPPVARTGFSRFVLC